MVGWSILKLDHSPVRAVVRHLGCSCHPDCNNFTLSFDCVAQKADDSTSHVSYLKGRAWAYALCLSYRVRQRIRNRSTEFRPYK
jgi:hypothetical protein